MIQTGREGGAITALVGIVAGSVVWVISGVGVVRIFEFAASVVHTLGPGGACVVYLLDTVGVCNFHEQAPAGGALAVEPLHDAVFIIMAGVVSLDFVFKRGSGSEHRSHWGQSTACAEIHAEY